MTDQDNLRDRIASVVAERNAYFGGHTGRADPKAVAQAIIDELDLTTETHAATQAKRNMTRITGAWEWDNQ